MGIALGANVGERGEVRGDPPMNTKLLVVEDEKVVSTYFKTYFGKVGFEVDVAASGEEARALLASGAKYDLVLLDLVLPDVIGLELLREMKAQDPIRPVIVVTGVPPDEEIVTECKAAGADSYVPKRSTIDQLLMHVNRSLRRI